MKGKTIIITIGILSLILSIGTWVLDLTDLVDKCIYCQTQRTIIGLLGIILLVPGIQLLRSYLGMVLGFFGANVSSAQIFLNLKNEHYISIMLTLALCALFWIIGQVLIITLLNPKSRWSITGWRLRDVSHK